MTQVNDIDVTCLQHSQIVELLTLRHAGINIAAVRSAANSAVISAQIAKMKDAGGALSLADVKHDPRLSSNSKVELRVGAGGETVDERAALSLTQRTFHCRDSAKTANKIAATASSTSSSLMSTGVHTSRDRRVARKTQSSVNGVTMTSPTAGPSDKQLTRTADGRVKMATELCPIEVPLSARSFPSQFFFYSLQLSYVVVAIIFFL